MRKINKLIKDDTIFLSAIDLHKFLKTKQKYSEWVKSNLIDNTDLILGVHYVLLNKKYTSYYVSTRIMYYFIKSVVFKRRNKSYTKSEVLSLLNKNGYKIYNKLEYKNAHTPILCYTKEDYIVLIKISSLQDKPYLFHKSNPFTLNNIQKWISLHTTSIELKENQIYKNNSTKLILLCNKHGEFEKTWAHLQKHPNCPICTGSSKTPNNYNSVYKKRPDLIKYFNSKEDSKKYTSNSNKKYEFKCPDCGYKKIYQINTLTNYGFSCDVCSDGISIPEKFCRNLLDVLNINYEFHKRFYWSNNKEYDFYLNEHNLIIEIHGSHHYTDTGVSKHQEVKKNDTYKKDLAFKNNINRYIEINAIKSTEKWLSDSFYNELKELFELDNIKWDKVFKRCLVSNVINANNLWEEYKNAKEIAKKLKLSYSTILKYLKIGELYNLSTYSLEKQKKQQLINLNKESVKSNIKKVIQYNLNGDFMQEFSSLQEADKHTGVSFSNISSCARGVTKTAGNFIWGYK